MTIKNKERRIIQHLRKDSRKKLTAISRETQIPVSSIFDVLRNSDKIIKHTCIADFSKLGYAVRATLTIKVDPKDREILREYLLKHQNTNSLWKINNGYDYMCEMIFRTIEDLEDFSDSLGFKFNLVKKEMYYIIKDIAREIFMSEPNQIRYDAIEA